MIDNFFAEILRGVSAGRIVWDPVNGTLNGLDYDDYVYPGHAIWWLARGLEFFQDGEQFGELLFTNPTGAFQFLLYVVVVDFADAHSPDRYLAGPVPAVAVGCPHWRHRPPGSNNWFGGPIRPERHSVCCDTRRCTGADTRRGRAAYVGGRRGGPCSRRAGHAPRLSTRTGGSGRRHRSRPDAAGDCFGGFPPYLVGGGGPGIGFGSGQSAHAKAAASDSAAAESAAQASARAQARAARRGRSAAKARGHP